MLSEFEYNGKAMGTEYHIAIVCDEIELANQIHQIIRNDINQYENIFSRFLPTSELSLLNEKKNMIVSEIFFRATQEARKLFFLTKGVFNPLVQISRLGYDKNFTDIKNNEIILYDSLYDIDFSSVILNPKDFHIHLNDGQKLDYGGFLKGYLAEILAKKIKSSFSRVAGAIVNLGGDIYTEGLDKNGHKFIFNIYNPISKEDQIKVMLHNQSLTTSGVYKRFWQKGNKKIHHILDKSGLKNPDSDISSVSVIGEEGAIAEAFTKVLMSINSQEALKLLDHKNISFIIIKNDGQVVTNMKINNSLVNSTLIYTTI